MGLWDERSGSFECVEPKRRGSLCGDTHTLFSSCLQTLSFLSSLKWFRKRESAASALGNINDLHLASRKFYDLLEVAPDASEADLKKAYRKKCVRFSFFAFESLSYIFRALRLHPDKGGDPELFKEVTHA